MNYTESNAYHDEGWMHQDWDFFEDWHVVEDKMKKTFEDQDLRESFTQLDLPGEKIWLLQFDEGKLLFDGSLKVFRGKLEYLPVLYVQLAPETLEQQVEFYNLNSHASLLRYIGVAHGKISDCVLFEYQELKSLSSFLPNADFSQRFKLILEMTQIFCYFSAKYLNFAPNLQAFCLSREDHLVLYNPTAPDDFFSTAPETLSCGMLSSKTSSWALGMILFEILTQKHPFSEESFSQLREISENLSKDQIIKKKEEFFLLSTQKSLKLHLLEDHPKKNKEISQNWIIGIKNLLQPLARSRISLEDFQNILKEETKSH